MTQKVLSALHSESLVIVRLKLPVNVDVKLPHAEDAVRVLAAALPRSGYLGL